MPNTRDFIEHVLELAAPAGRVSARPMFGGHGIYVDGTIAAIIVDDELYLKTDDKTRGAFTDLELPPFTYRTHKDGAVHVTSYYRAPDEALESPPAMREWLRRALAASLAKRTTKVKRPRR
jgi:DNA transformation protein and related proteins